MALLCPPPPLPHTRRSPPLSHREEGEVVQDPHLVGELVGDGLSLLAYGQGDRPHELAERGVDVKLSAKKKKRPPKTCQNEVCRLLIFVRIIRQKCWWGSWSYNGGDNSITFRLQTRDLLRLTSCLGSEGAGATLQL